MSPTRTTFLMDLDARVKAHALLDHPFYQLWNEGKLSQEVLRDYARQYFAHVKAFPTYVSAVHAQIEDDIPLRQALVENLMEEEQGPNNHPELWLRFAEGLGAERESVQGAPLLDETQASVAEMRRLTRLSAMEGLAALYAYESQVPEVATTKKAGLKAFYGIEDARSTDFFTVHEGADVLHSQVERDALSRAVDADPSLAEPILNAAEAGAKALSLFLDGVYGAYIQPAAA